MPNTRKSLNLPPFISGSDFFYDYESQIVFFCGWYEINGNNGFAESGSNLLQRLELCDRIRILVFVVVEHELVTICLV